MSTYTVDPLPDYRPPLPIPNIPLVLASLSSTAAAFVSPPLLAAYESSLKSDILTSAQSKALLGTLEAIESNWSSHWFLKILLSTRWPVPTSSRLNLLLALPSPLTRAQAVAALLRAVGLWTKEYILPGGSGVYTPAQQRLEWQLRGLCAAFRVPVAEKTCELQYGDPARAKHAAVWCRGCAWRVTVIDEDGVVLAAEDIERQIVEVLESALGEWEPSLAAVSWRLGRKEWGLARAAYMGIPENKVAMEALYGALVSVSLEDGGTPEDMAERLNVLRNGEASENRFADQTLSIVSYEDGTTALSFDHAPADCGPAIELSTLLLTLASSTQYPSSIFPTIIPSRINIILPPMIPPIRETYVDALIRTVKTIDLSLPANPRMTDTLLNLALQAALLTTMGRIPTIWQPVLLRGFKYGRCDEMVPVTVESVRFAGMVGARVKGDGEDEDKKDGGEEMKELFEDACRRRRELIGEKQNGMTMKYFQQFYLHPYLEALLSSSDSEAEQNLNIVCQVLRKINSVPCVTFTGFTLDQRPQGEQEEGEGRIEAGISNIFMEDQLAVFYVHNGEAVRVTVSGTGVWRGLLERGEGGGVLEMVERCWGIVRGVAEG